MLNVLVPTSSTSSDAASTIRSNERGGRPLLG
jgi:hypothetical protein